MHERQAIREAIVAALTGETDAEDRVSKSRQAPHPTSTLPAISVYTDDEVIDEKSRRVAPRELKRTARVSIDIWAGVPAGGEVDDALDALALQVETAMDADLNLRNPAPTAFDSILLSTEIGFSNAGNRPMGCAHLVYAVDYHTDLRIEAPTDDFDTAHVAYENIGDGAIAADDQVTDLIQDIHE